MTRGGGDEKCMRTSRPVKSACKVAKVTIDKAHKEEAGTGDRAPE